MQHIQSISSKSRTDHWKLTGWLIWLLAAFFYAYEFLHRVALGVLTTHLREALSVNDLQLGMIGAMYFYAYAAFQLPAGILTDRFGVRKLLITASGILTVGSFLFTFTDSSMVAQISRFMIGMGSAFAFVGCLKIAAESLAPRAFPLVVGLTNLCGTLGALSGGTPLAYWVEQMGWRDALFQVSIIGVLVTLLMALFLPKQSTQPLPQTNTAVSLLTGIKNVALTPRAWLIALYGALLVAPIAALPEMWGVDYVKIAYQLPAPQAASITHSIFIGTALGGPLIGLLVSRFQHPLLFMRVSTFAALLLLVIFLSGMAISPTLLTFMLIAYGIFTANMLLCFSLITHGTSANTQGTAIGFVNMVIMALGGVGQHVIGWVLHRLSDHHSHTLVLHDYQIALSFLPVCLLVALGISFILKRN